MPSFTATSASFLLSQGANVPVHKFDFGKFVYLPVKKLVTITSYTRELFQHSVPNIEAAVRATILEGHGPGARLDYARRDAADVTRPAGLLAGITDRPAMPLRPRPAMKEDVGALGAAVSAVAGNRPILFIAVPETGRLAFGCVRRTACLQVLPSGRTRRWRGRRYCDQLPGDRSRSGPTILGDQ